MKDNFIPVQLQLASMLYEWPRQSFESQMKLKDRGVAGNW